MHLIHSLYQSLNLFPFRFRLTHTLSPNSSTWINLNFFYYADGTLNAPLLRSNPDYHFLSNIVRVIGFVLLGTGMVYCLANVLWITCNSTHRILILSQPPLLLQLCFGSMMILATILPISFDENSGLSIQQLSISCKLIPWLVVIGQIIQYMALFTKVRLQVGKLFHCCDKTTFLNNVDTCSFGEYIVSYNFNEFE